MTCTGRSYPFLWLPDLGKKTTLHSRVGFSDDLIILSTKAWSFQGAMNERWRDGQLRGDILDADV